MLDRSYNVVLYSTWFTASCRIEVITSCYTVRGSSHRLSYNWSSATPSHYQVARDSSSSSRICAAHSLWRCCDAYRRAAPEIWAWRKRWSLHWEDGGRSRLVGMATGRNCAWSVFPCSCHMIRSRFVEIEPRACWPEMYTRRVLHYDGGIKILSDQSIIIVAVY